MENADAKGAGDDPTGDSLQGEVAKPVAPFMVPTSQEQVPECDPVYSYYIRTYGSLPSCALQIPEEEISQAMAEAKRSYTAWKQMQQKLRQIIQEQLM